jgi:hypothetical protein
MLSKLNEIQGPSHQRLRPVNILPSADISSIDHLLAEDARDLDAQERQRFVTKKSEYVAQSRVYIYRERTGNFERSFEIKQSPGVQATLRMADDSEYNEELDGFETENARDGQQAAVDGDGANGEGEFEEEALEEDEDASARGGVNMDAATVGIVKMQARARGMLTRKHDAQELAQLSTVTKAEARAERRAALGKPASGDAREGQQAAADGEGEFEEEALEEDEDVSAHVASQSRPSYADASNLHSGISNQLSVADSHQRKFSTAKQPPSVSKSSIRDISYNARSPDYEVLEGSQQSPLAVSRTTHHPVGITSNLNQSASEHNHPSESLVSFTSPRSSPGITAPATFSFNASAAPGDPVSQALLKKLFAIEQSVSLLQAQIVKCLASDDSSVYDQLHNSNIQVEKLMRIRSEILVALQHQQQMAATSPKVAGASNSHLMPHKFNSVSPLSHSSKAKAPLPPVEYGYMSDNASSTTFSASSHTNGDFSSSVSHSALTPSDDMYCLRIFPLIA